MSDAATAPKRAQTDHDALRDYLARHPDALRPGEFEEWSQSSAKQLAFPIRMFGDALMIGKIDDDLLDRPIVVGFSEKGLNTKSDGWTNWDTIREDRKTYPVHLYEFIEQHFTSHEEGPKDGPCVLQGELSGKRRISKNAKANHFLILDFDTGLDFDKLVTDMRDRGLFAIVHTSHSHMATNKAILRDDLVKFCGHGTSYDPTDEDAQRYLRDYLKVQPAYCEGARIIEKMKHDDGGIFTVVAHPPLPKMRLILLLKEPYVFAKAGTTQAGRIDEWKVRYLAVSEAFGIFCDAQCQDPARLFYLPRHKKGANDYRITVVAGEAFDFEGLPQPPAEKGAQTTKTAGGTIRKAKPERVRDLTLPLLAPFWKKYGKRFDVVRFFEDHCENSTDRPDGGLRCDCPDGDAHGNGDPGGFWCQNGKERENGWPIASCSHETHHGFLTEDFVDLLASALSDFEAAKDLWNYVLEKGEGETCDIEDGAPFGSFEEALVECGRGKPTKPKEQDLRDPRHLLTLARRIGASTCLKAGEPLLLLNQLKNPTVSLPSLKEAMQAGARKRARSTEHDDAGLPEGFEVVDDLTRRKVWKNEKEEWITVCSPIRNLGFLYDENGQGHGHLIEAVDRLGNKKQIGFRHSETVRDSGAFLGRLADEGNVWFDGTTEARGHAVALFSRLPVAEPILNASKPGFHTHRDALVYIPPVGEPIGVDEGTVRLQETARLPKTEAKGTLEGWLASATELVAISDFHALMILSAGFAGVIVALCRIPSCGMGFTGTSSVGKSLAMKIAAAASSAVHDAAGLFMSATGSATGQELSVAQGNGATFFLDEIKLLPAKAIQSILFMLAEGQGRVRGTAALTRAKTTTWSSYFVYSGELETEKLIALGDDAKAGGLDRRFPEVDTSGAKGCTDDARVKALEARVNDNYGHALPAFVQWLFDGGYTQDRDRLLRMITTKAGELLGKEGGEKPAAVRAAAFNVAIANVAGMLAKEAGLMPDVDIDAAFRTGWARSLGAEGASFAGDAEAAVVEFWGNFGAVFHLHGVLLNGDPGEMSQPETGAQHRTHLFYMGSALQHEGRRYVVIRDHREADKLLIKAGVKREALFREMGGAFIKHGKNRVWTDMPKECGGGPGKHFRILLPESFVIPESMDE